LSESEIQRLPAESNARLLGVRKLPAGFTVDVKPGWPTTRLALSPLEKVFALRKPELRKLTANRASVKTNNRPLRRALCKWLLRPTLPYKL
jgi:hypothetical protein